MSEEGLKETENHLIHISEPIKFDSEMFLKNLEILMIVAYNNQAVYGNPFLGQRGCGQNPGPIRRCPYNVYAQTNDGCCRDIHAIA